MRIYKLFGILLLFISLYSYGDCICDIQPNSIWVDIDRPITDTTTYKVVKVDDNKVYVLNYLNVVHIVEGDIFTKYCVRKEDLKYIGSNQQNQDVYEKDKVHLKHPIHISMWPIIFVICVVFAILLSKFVPEKWYKGNKYPTKGYGKAMSGQYSAKPKKHSLILTVFIGGLLFEFLNYFPKFLELLLNHLK